MTHVYIYSATCMIINLIAFMHSHWVFEECRKKNGAKSAESFLFSQKSLRASAINHCQLSIQ